MIISTTKETCIVTLFKEGIAFTPNAVTTDEGDVYGCVSVGPEAEEDVAKQPLQLIFPDVTSLDMLIDSLQEVRNFMTKPVDHAVKK